jgi:4-methylaminobutanoate oxidase (formaldehyde-forming)
MIQSTSKKENLPEKKKVVIIGGGIVGCSVAYHLAKLGWQDIAILDKDEFPSENANRISDMLRAGGSDSWATVEMADYSLNLLEEFPDFAQRSGSQPVGSLELALNDDQLIALRRRKEFITSQAIECEEISGSQIREHWSNIQTDDVLAGFITKNDALVDPTELRLAYLNSAVAQGVEIYEGVEVTAILRNEQKVTGVATPFGKINAEFVVNCSGLSARAVGKLANANVPIQAVAQYIWHTTAIDTVSKNFPILQVGLNRMYHNQKDNNLTITLVEQQSSPWDYEGFQPVTLANEDPIWNRLSPQIDKILQRLNVDSKSADGTLSCHPVAITTDHAPLLGEASELQNFFIAAGFNSLKTTLSAGAGRIVANWIVTGLPDVDVSELDIARMLPHQNTKKYLADRSTEVLGKLFGPSYPGQQFSSARNAKQSPYHDRLAHLGAYFGTYGDWETPYWFAAQGKKAERENSWERPTHFQYIADEHLATRNGVTLTDYSVMGKILVSGKDAEALLNKVSANNMAVAVGRCVYTQWLNEAGGIIADLTVTRVTENEFLVLTGDATSLPVEMWLRRHSQPEDQLIIKNITSSSSALTIQGPKSRELIQKISSADLSNKAFPYLTMQEIEIAHARVQALRITYVGELGYELYIPSEFSLNVFDSLVEAGKDIGMQLSGIDSVDSLRLEKGYRDIGNDIGNLDTPLEVGLKFAVDFEKPGGFIGKQALEEKMSAGPPTNRLVQFLLEDPEPLLFGNEPIYKEGILVGNILAAAYGHSLGAAVGAGTVEHPEGVTPDFITSGNFEILSVGELLPAKASLRALYDPKNKKVKL